MKTQRWTHLSVACLLVAVASLESAEKVIIDTDPGVDDAIAVISFPATPPGACGSPTRS